MKTKIIGILVCMLLIASAAVIPAKVSEDDPVNVEINNANVIKLDVSIGSLSMQGESMGFSSNNMVPSIASLDGGVAFDGPGDQTHPGIIMAEDGIFGAGYYDEYTANITQTWSTDYGQTWDPGIPGENDWDYPTGDLWEGSRMFATALCNPNVGLGGYGLVIDVEDATDPLTWTVWSLPWSDYGWYNQSDVDIACDSSQNDWQWGVNSYVFSTTYGTGYVNAPTVMFADPDIEGDWWINWIEPPYPVYNGSAHTDVDIDLETHQVYSVYDWYNDTSGMWELILWTFDFTDPLNWALHIPYLIKGTGNLRHPVVAAYNDNLVILAETDENGNKDIICYYSDDGVNDLQTVFVADSGNDEQYPNMCHVSGLKFVGTYIESNNLYASITEDGGATWDDTRWQINENDGAVVEGYKTSYLCNKGRMSVWEEAHDDIDCYVGLVYNDAPDAPDIDGPASGAAGTKYDYTFTAVDPTGDYIAEYIVDWGDGTGEETITGPFASEATASHTWDEQGDYTITAKAIDVFDAEGPEGTLEVSMPRNRVLSNTLFYQFLQNHPHVFPILRYLLGL